MTTVVGGGGIVIVVAAVGIGGHGAGHCDGHG